MKSDKGLCSRLFAGCLMCVAAVLAPVVLTLSCSLGGDMEHLRPKAKLGTSFLPAPAGVTATKEPGMNTVRLTWGMVSGADSYNVYRSDSENGTYEKLNINPLIVLFYEDTGLTVTETYYYRVAAISVDGLEGEKSDAVSVTVTVDNISLAATFDWINENAQDDSEYIVAAWDDEVLAPVTVSPSAANVHIILNGGETERIIQLSNNGSLFEVGSGVTLTLGDNITLRGHADNNASLVTVNSGGTLEMNTGAKITGNTVIGNVNGGGVCVNGGTFTMNGGDIYDNYSELFSPTIITTSNGGGVYVSSSGTYIMNGGKISNNSASDSGGGVCVNGGTFTMNGGEISDNTAYTRGGGVFVGNSGDFTMEGGKISANTSSRGGGVCVGDSGDFTMEGGEISGNATTGMGGGVCVNDGTFTMKKGKISNNTTYSEGSGVFVGDSGDFTMEGGEISGNNTDSRIDDGYGGGVFVGNSGTFRIVTGTVYGNETTIDEALRNTATNNGAALFNNGTAQYGNGGTWTDFSLTPSDSRPGYYTNNTIKVTDGVLQ